jgi:hypothetical protein
MYDSKIVSAEALAASLEDRIAPLRNMLSLVGDCIDATGCDAAVQGGRQTDFSALAHRYGHAGSIARRRIDALLHEAEIESMAGCGLIASRGDRTAPGTAAAARFLHRRMRSAFARIDQLLPLAA